MQEIINEQANEQEIQIAEAEKVSGEEGVQASLGKFKSVDALLNAYNSLQAEFTKRCQRLKELEGTVKADKTEVPTFTEEETDLKEKGITEEEKNQILKGYLQSILGSKQKALVMDKTGVGVRTPSPKPKTISEAGALAKEIMQN